MDEQFVRACNYEDWDFAWRLYEGGFKAVWDPGPWCYHAATPQGRGAMGKLRCSVGPRLQHRILLPPAP